ncbi:NusG domain II-containing protein [Clostridium sp. D53t1_180928_C8]|uniref:NusG domain II-containing protein n=1 Tax=Clostridium sp. D53t1_180928_C8 TaxID=2787101 RepID=UPI0018AA29A3|nr:NusG domain II-containing protein [Clostridium sp. D53t1_180928_C8]
MKIKKTYVLILLFTCIILSAISLLLIKTPSKGTIANIYKDGICIYSIDLSKVTSPYEISLKYDDEINIVSIEKNKISIIDANCNDKICVNQGHISNTITPIVCLPHKIIIKIEKDNKLNEFDGISQ